MTNIVFSSGLEELDLALNSVPDVAHLFQCININRINAGSKKLDGHPLILPSVVEVSLYIDVDDQMSYAVESYLDMSGGRMKISDFVVKQTWTETSAGNIMSMVAEDGQILVKDLTAFTVGLALMADAYRFGHAMSSSD